MKRDLYGPLATRSALRYRARFGWGALVLSAAAVFGFGSAGTALMSTISSPTSDAAVVSAASHSSIKLLGAGVVGVTNGAKQVDEGFGQIFAPHDWFVQAQDGCPMGTPHGSVLLVGVTPADSQNCTTFPPLDKGRSVVWIFESSAKVQGKPSRVVNGFDLYLVPASALATGYAIPALGIDLLWRGAAPEKVIDTLSWSPLHYVLTRHLASTPKGWKYEYFKGIGVAAPASWPVKHPLVLVCSGPFDHGPVVGLGVKVIPVPCPYFAPPTTPSDGVLITARPQLGACPISAMLNVAGQKAIACNDPSVQPPELQVKLVFGSGSTAATVYVIVGLGHEAAVASRILGSVEAIVPLG